MPSLVAKKKGNKLYYYVVESARVEGKPRIVHQAYLGTAEKLAEMVRDRAAPLPLAASMREFGLPAALWSVAQQTGVVGFAPVPLARATLRPVASPLFVAGGPASRVSARAQDGGGRLVSQIDPFGAVGRLGRALQFASFLGRIRTDSAGRPTRSPLGKRPAGKSSVSFAELVEGKAAGESSAAGVRHHQLLHLYRQQQCAQSTGAAWTQQAGPTQPAPGRTQLCAGWGAWLEPVSSRLPRQCRRCGRVFDGFGAHHPHAG